ncbi:MAG: polysaccharide deacetylase family protein [Chloroflexi bacterium]|nr:polysaccharide deacetylase family protein [Chloroflexota bacterium]
MLTTQTATIARLFPDVTSGRLVRARLPILRYCSLDEQGSACSLAPELFRWQMKLLLANGWRVLGLDALLAGLGSGWPSRSAVLTFDEGYRNFRDHALPYLHGYAYAAFLFVAPVDSRSAPGRRGPRTLMDWPALRVVAGQGITLGLRLPAEPDLRRMSPADAETALSTLRARLEDRLGLPVTAFASPYDTLPDWLRILAGQQFRAGFSARLGFARAAGTALALDRVDVRVLRNRRLFRALESGWIDTYLHARQALRDLQTHS